MKRLRQEISSIMEGRKAPSREQIRRMKYLSCVIKESELCLNVSELKSLIPCLQVFVSTRLFPSIIARRYEQLFCQLVGVQMEISQYW